MIGFVSFLLPLFMIPLFAGGATIPRWALLALLVPFWLRFNDEIGVKRPWTWAHVFGFAALGWAALTVLWSPYFPEAINGLLHLLLIAGLFSIGIQLGSLRNVFIGLAIGLSINSVLVILQTAGVELYLPQTSAPAGLFVNKNYLAEPTALVIIGLIGYKLWWYIPALLPSLILPHHKGSFIALGVVFGLYLWTRSRMLAVSVLILIPVLTIGWLAWRGNGDPNSWTIYADSWWDRLNIWRDTIAGFTPFGHGIGSYYNSYPEHATYHNLVTSRPEHAHNDYLELIYELGIGSAFVFGLLAYACLGRARNPERMVLSAFLVLAALDFPTYFPVTCYLAGLSLGSVCRDRDGVRLPFAWRRVRLLAWLGERWRPQGSLALYGRSGKAQSVESHHANG